MKTPLTTLDDWIKDKQLDATVDYEYVFGLIRGQIAELKVLERKMIEGAFVAGVQERHKYTIASQYFEEEFNQ